MKEPLRCYHGLKGEFKPQKAIRKTEMCLWIDVQLVYLLYLLAMYHAFVFLWRGILFITVHFLQLTGLTWMHVAGRKQSFFFFFLVISKWTELKLNRLLNTKEIRVPKDLLYTWYILYYIIYGKIPWRRKWQPTPVFLLGKFHKQRSLAGYSPWGYKQLNMVEAT